MSATILSSQLLHRLSRSIVVGSVLTAALFTGACSDDDDDGTGPSADCIDEIDFAGAPFDRSDVETINVGQVRSGSLTTSDPEVFGYFMDFYAVDLPSGTASIIVDPAASLDADVALFYTDGNSEDGWYADSGFEGETEDLQVSVDAGCYLIGVSSFEEGATGSYTLRVED